MPDPADIHVIGMEVETWRMYALCAETDPEIFFPHAGESNLDAKRVCAACDVRRQCLEYALARDDMGVWGGLSRLERTRLKTSTRRERKAA